MDIFALDHSFGDEIETSMNQLFKFMLNNLKIGQLHIVKTCLKQLFNQEKLLCVNLGSVLCSVIKDPNIFCSGSLCLKSPFYFAYLLNQIILENEYEFKVEKSFEEITEFRIIFYSQFENFFSNRNPSFYPISQKSQLIRNELEEIISKPRKMDEFDAEINDKKTTLDFIKKLMIFDIFQAKRLLTLILLNNPLFEFCIVEFHVQLLNERLESLELQFNNVKNTENLNFQKFDIFSLTNLFSIYDKLNSLTFSCNRKFELIAMIQRFFKRYSIKINTICENFEHVEYLNAHFQMALLKSEFNSPLLETFIKMNYEINRQSIISNNLNDINLIILSIIKSSLKNNFIGIGKIFWKKLFFYTLVEKRSFIESLIDECLILISKNHLNFLSPIFSIREFGFLKILILLIGTSKAKDIITSHKLISILNLNCNKETSIDTILHILKNHLDFISWFLLKFKKNQSNDICSNQLIKVLRRQMPLNIINDNLDLNKLEYSEIIKILSNKFVKKDENKCLAIFNGFYCINQILKCIIFCCENLNDRLYNNLESIKTTSYKNNINMSLEGKNMENEKSDSKSDLIKQIYQENIIPTLESVKINVCKIEPLDYRLEILENIYALIFIKNKDLFKNSEYENDHLADDDEYLYNPIITIQNVKSKSFEDFEIVENYDKEMEFSINEDSTEQLKENSSLKTNLDLNNEIKFKRTGKYRNKYNRQDKQDIVQDLNRNYSKKAAGGDSFLTNDFLCRDILLTLKDCLNSFSSVDEKLENFHKIHSRSKKLLQLVNETLWRFQLIKPVNIKVDFGQINIITNSLEQKHIINDNEQNLVYHFMRKRQRRDSNISSITNHDIVKNENLTMSLNRSFKNLDFRINNTSQQNRANRRSLGSNRSLSLIYPQTKNSLTNSTIMKIISEIKTLSVICLKECKSNEANQLVKLYSTKLDVANLFEFDQISFNSIYQNSMDEILLLDSQKSTETIHEQSLLNLKISKIINNLIQFDKSKPLVQSLIICDFLITLRIDIKIIIRLIEFVSINLNQKETEIFLDSDMECFDKKVFSQAISFIDSIKSLELVLKNDILFKKEHFLDYISTYDGISIFTKYSERSIIKMFENINNYLESIQNLDLFLEELESCEDRNFDNVYDKILNQFESKMNNDFIKFFVANFKKTENLKTSDFDYSEENIETLFLKRDNCGRREPILLDSKISFNYLLSFNEYTKKLSDYLREKNFQSNFDFKFYILDFSPALLICKLLFDDFLKPESIEPLTESLNLNLTAIILHNSCPRLKLISCENKSTCFSKIDRLKLISNVSVYENDFFYSILNENNVYSCLMKKPDVFIKDLLNSILKYLTLQPNKMLDAKSVWQIYNSTEFKNILKQTQQIQNLNLDYLKTKNEKLSFFINLHNLLTIHANLFLLSSKFSKKQVSKKNSINRKKILNDNLFLDDTGEIVSHKNYTFEMLFQQKMCYKVGQMGCVSLFDLKHIILLRKKNELIYKSSMTFSFENQQISPLKDSKNSKLKSIFSYISPKKLSSSPKIFSTENDSSFKCEIESNNVSLFELDLKIEPSWSKYIPKNVDFKVMFGLINCVESDPKICVYDSDDILDSQLEMQMTNFLNQTVYADIETEILYIPSLLLENLSYFSNVTNVQKISYCYDLNFDQKNSLEILIKFLADKVNPELKAQINNLLNLDSIHCYGENIDLYGQKELPFQIVELKKSEKFYLSLEDDFSDEKMKWHKSQLEKILKKEHLDKNKENIFLEKETNHTKKLLNSECLEYISKNSPLIFKNLGFLFDIQIREKFFTAINEKKFKNIIEYEQDKNNCNNNFLNRFIQLYVPLDFMNHMNMDLKLDMVTQFLFNSKTEKFKVESIIDLANYYCLRNEWKSVIDLLENCTQDNEEFFDFRELAQVSNLEFSVKFITEISCLNTYSKFIQKDIYNLFDHACISYANQETKHFEKSYCYLFKINNFKRQIRAVFGLMYQWPIEGCLESIDFLVQKCKFFQLTDLNSNEAEYLASLIDVLFDQKKEFAAYQDLISCAQNVLEKYYENQQVQEFADLYDSNNPKCSFSTNELNSNYNLNFNKVKKICQLCLTWQYPKAQLEASNQDNDEAKELIMDLFLINEKFENAKYLIKKFNLNQKLAFKIDFGHLKYRLLNFNSLSSVIEIDLESILNECISFSREDKPQYDLYLFKICFKLINELKEYNDLNNQVLISLSEFLIQNFKHFLNNEKLDELKIIQLTAKIFQIIVQEKCIYFDSYKRHHSQPIFIIEQLLMNGKIDLCAKTIKLCRNYLKSTKLNDEINQLLVLYAHKALEFQFYTDPKKDYSDDEQEKSITRFRFKILNKSMNSNTNTRFSPRKNSILSNFKTNRSLFEEHSPKSPNFKFIMPIVPPSKEDWVKDEEVNYCMVCKVSKFSLINRRHHCRRCGRVVCGLCSQKLTMIENIAKRTCDDCFRHLEILKDNDKVSSPIDFKTQRKNPKCSILSQDINIESNDEKNSFYLIGNDMNETSVKRDEEVRKNFRYSQSPSTSLCLSILDLHDNLLECGKSLLSLCDDLSLYLQNANQQEDHALVINMLKHLLQNAKVKLLQNSSSNIISLCDSYLSLIDILEQLLLANCSIIPSLNELINGESVRRIRNRLLEEERHDLAMNLSTKCGLDTQTVWASWGLIELKRSNYKEARGKFEKCLKPLSEKNPLNNSTNLKILNDIINYFEMTPPIRMQKNIKSMLSQPIDIESLVSEPKMFTCGTNLLNISEFNESLFYLETYGNSSLIVSFFVRNGFLKNAIEYLVEKKCNSEVFIETILITNLKSGDFFSLIEIMLNMEKLQNKLYPYYLAIGKFLEKNGYVNTLYDFQIQMKDFVRCCMSCIYFFTKNAKTYLDLYNNLHYLNKAREHLEQYSHLLAKKQINIQNQSRKLRNDSNFRKQMTFHEIESYKNAINLQIEITKFIYNSKNETSIDEKPLTLFANNEAKITLCCKILLTGPSVQDGFGFVIRIIQCFNLNSTLVFCQISRELAKKFNLKEINNLLKCIDESGYDEDKDVTFDECISTCIRVFAADNENFPNHCLDEIDTCNRNQKILKHNVEIENLIQKIKNDENKINAFILNGKLKSAYLIAIRIERVDIVKHISNVAERVGQNLVKDICVKWLNKIST